jgi:hypothetical protein
MLAKIAPRFVISRVIQTAYFVDMMSVELLKQPFGTHRNYFGCVNPEKFYVITQFNAVMQILRLYFDSFGPYIIPQQVLS